MIRSMTAFAGNETEINNLSLNCELRSVNHRYCDINFKLPEHLRFIEGDIRTLINSKLKRGKIECAINFKKRALGTPFTDINTPAIESLLTATRAIEQMMPSARSFSALEVLAFPGIQQEPEFNKEDLGRAVKTLVEQTIEKMVDVREREGEQLEVLIQDRCKLMQDLVAAAHKRMPIVLIHLREKLKLRIHELVSEPDFDRLEQELVILTQKLDVDEELDRLETHITEVLHVLKAKEPVGRRLDFIMQEMNREANTLGSKSADKEMTNIAIDLKVLIEQMREQIQNVE